MSLHPDYFVPEMADLLAWTAAHVNVSMADTPSVWSVLRGWEYPFVGASGKGVSGKMGNWEQGLTVIGGKRVWRAELPANARDDWRSRQCRMGDVFGVVLPDLFVRDEYTLRVTYLDVGYRAVAAVWHDAKTGNQVVRSWSTNDTGQWLTIMVELTGIAPGADIMLDADGQIYLHQIEVVGENILPTPTATASAFWTATPTSAPDWTATPSATPTVQELTKTVTSSATPTATWTATIAPTPTVSTSTPTMTEPFTLEPTATVTSTPSACPTETPTATPSIEDEMRRLADRYEAERGAQLRFWVEVGE